MYKLCTPVSNSEIMRLNVYDQVEITGYIYTGRDAVLPKLVKDLDGKCPALSNIDLKGSLIFHTAVSPAGIGPTSSNKFDIESTIPQLSAAGVKIHMGKGALSDETTKSLDKFGSIYVVTPPVSALFTNRITSIETIAYKEEGMEAMHKLTVERFPAIVAIAHGKSIFDG